MARRTAHAMAAIVALAAVCGSMLAAADGDFLQQFQQNADQVFQQNNNNFWGKGNGPDNWFGNNWPFNGQPGLPNTPGVCQAFQWSCKSSCSQACCHIQTGVSSPQCFCSQGDADNSGLDHQWCCQGSGPWTDPIFTDFQNRTFEFFGDSGSVYNVLTHAGAVVNMRLAPAGARHLRHQDGGGTFTDVLAFKFGDTQVLVEASESGSMAVTVDDEELDLDKVFTEDAKDVKISFTPHAPNVGERVELNSDLFTFVVTAVKSFEDDVTGYNRGHLDLSTLVKAPPGHMDGVLGASLYVKPQDRLRDPSERKFHDSEADYVVPNLFEGMEIRHASTRRRSLIEGAAIDRLSFPLRAVLQ